jgi:ABC-2 type transport system permease protein
MTSRILNVARNEWRVLKAERVLWVAGGLLLAAVAYAVWVGTTWRATRAEDVRQEVAAAEERLAEHRRTAARGEGVAPGAVSYPAVLPPGPLADFDLGQSDLYPYRAEVSIRQRFDNLFGEYQLQSPLALLTGRFDFAFVVLYLLPLLLIGLSYDLLSEDKEQGTLALTLAQPIGLKTLAAGKALLRLLVAMGALTAFCVGGLLLSGELSAERWVRFGLWLALVVAYGLFWLGLAFAVAACGWRSEANAAVLAGAWILLVLVVPGLLNIAVQVASPVPPRLEYVTTLRHTSNETSKASAELLARYYHEHPELAAAGEQQGFLPRFYASQREVDRRLAPVMEELEDRLRAQQALVERWRFLSPAVVLKEALDDVAGSSPRRQWRYTEQAQEYLARWHQRLSPKIFLGAALGPEELGGLPRFSFEEEPLAVMGRRVVVGLAGLLLPAAALALWGWRRLRRYPVVG